MKCPPFSNTFVFADDARLAAQLCCALSVAGVYLPVCDGPRMQRPDRKLEVLRRHNAIGQTRANIVFMAGLADDAFDALRQSLTSRRSITCYRITSSGDIDGFKRVCDTLHWGRDRIGVGLLKALRAGQNIMFEDRPSPYEWVGSKSKHMVVCEEGEELAQVIAANYAFALNAGLFLIPEVEGDQAEDLLEGFYKLYDRNSGFAPAEAQASCHSALLTRNIPRLICSNIPILGAP